MWGIFVRVTGVQLEFSSLFLLVEDICCSCWRWCCWRIIGKMGRWHVEDGLLYTCLQVKLTLELTDHGFPLAVCLFNDFETLASCQFDYIGYCVLAVSCETFFSSNYFSQRFFLSLSSIFKHPKQFSVSTNAGRPPIPWDFSTPP